MLSCPSVKLINWSDESWTKEDMKSKRSAQKTCKKVYKDAPCLITFIKTEPQAFRAICGAKR